MPNPPASCPKASGSPEATWPTCWIGRGCRSGCSSRGPTSPASSCCGGLDMHRPTQIAIPTLVRAKDGALDRLGIYLGRGGHRQGGGLITEGVLPPPPGRGGFDPQETSPPATAARAVW